MSYSLECETFESFSEENLAHEVLNKMWRKTPLESIEKKVA